MFKIIETGDGKFGIKSQDIQGNSLGMRSESFDTYEEASKFIGTLEGGNVGLDAPASQNPSTSSAQTPGPEASAAPQAPLEGQGTHDKNDAPGPEDADHFLEVSGLEYAETADGPVTNFRVVGYYLNADGTKTVKGGEDSSFPGELNSEEVVEKVQSDLVAPGWKMTVVWAAEATPIPTE